MVVPELEVRAHKYADTNNLILDRELIGYGNDGSIWHSHLDTAIKVFEAEKNYLVERDCYQRLKSHNIFEIDGFRVPRLRGFDNELMVVEISIVSPPFILDFGKAYVDFWPEHTPEVMEDWAQEQQEIWEENWPQVQAILWKLEQIGIKYTDPNPGNIMFAKSQNDSR